MKTIYLFYVRIIDLHYEYCTRGLKTDTVQNMYDFISEHA